MNIILRGITGLLGSTKGTLCLIVIAGMFSLSLSGKLDNVGVGAMTTLIAAIYCYTRSKTDTPENRGI